MSVRIPKDFSPEKFPILSLHWIGLPPSPQANDRQPPVIDRVADFGVVRLGAALHRLGENVGANVINIQGGRP